MVPTGSIIGMNPLSRIQSVLGAMCLPMRVDPSWADFAGISACALQIPPGSSHSCFQEMQPEGKLICTHRYSNKENAYAVQVGFGDVWKQSLSELSGGQRSLLALSLILAMLLFKPAPIYILDEVSTAPIKPVESSSPVGSVSSMG